jgi:hypothetical protein
MQQQPQYTPNGTTSTQCGELVITASNGKQSVDSVTVTIGGKKPTVLAGGATIQSAIDAAAPGDLIIVPPGVYNEMLLMWKPVRLQGVGAASSVLNANTHPAGKMDPWRAQVSCLFGLNLNGQPFNGNFDPTGVYSCPGTGWKNFSNGFNNQPQVDRLPMEGVLGWDTSVNGNLAQLLQEPTLMGAYEGAGITVISKGVDTHGAAGYFGSGTTESAFPAGTTLLTGNSNDCGKSRPGANGYVPNPYPSNFQCNPSSIDGLSITNSSQGGGGILVHAWGHNLQIANNRVHNNSGTLTGGITIGQGESPDAYLAGTAFNTDPGSCESGGVTNSQLPYCFDTHVNVHHNAVTSNSSIGDELFSSTPAGSGGVTFCTGADYYKFNYNWVCGNLSTGDGGGVAHMGFIKNGDIEHNSILFNQSTNPTVPANGGGLIIMGAPPDGFTAAGIECGGTDADLDCVPGLSDGTGPNLVINANLIMGNAAEAGSGGGLRFQGVNGTEVSILPTRPDLWNSVTVTNNIIANNVAGWDGAGVSLQDALNVNIINNTIVGNDTTASAGVLFNTLGAPLSSSPGANCIQTGGTTQSCPQPAGLVAVGNSPQLIGSLTTAITCPVNHPNCASVSYPYLANDLFWQNRSFYIGVGQLSAQYQQNIVSLYNAFTTTKAASQLVTGACDPNASYWDIGVRGDQGPGNHASHFTLAPTYSVLTNALEAGSGSNNHLATNPNVVSQYCNGSRIPPEAKLPGGTGWQVPPGISDATVPNPIFNLSPSATVDEGNNWINMSWGPLALTNPTGVTLGNYTLQSNSPAIDAIGTNSPTYAVAPPTDFFGNPRPDVHGTQIDIGAVEGKDSLNPNAVVAPTSLAFGLQLVGTTSAPRTVTLSNTGDAALAISSITITAPFARAAGAGAGTCPATTGSLGIGSSCTINVVFSPTASGAATGSVTIASNDPANPTLAVALTGTGFTPIAGVSPTSLAFGNQTVGTTSATRTVTLSNTGNGPLTIASIGLTGANANQFATSNNTCPIGGTGLAAGTSCTIRVTFHPTTTGAKTASLTFTDNSNGVTGSTQNVSLSGTGTAPLAVVSFTGPVPALNTGGSSTKNGVITVHNTGTGALTLTAAPTIAKVSGAGTGTPSIQPGGTCVSGFVVAPTTGTCTINVRWVPINTSTANLNVTLTDTGAATGTQTSNTFPAN